MKENYQVNSEWITEKAKEITKKWFEEEYPVAMHFVDFDGCDIAWKTDILNKDTPNETLELTTGFYGKIILRVKDSQQLGYMDFRVVFQCMLGNFKKIGQQKYQFFWEEPHNIAGAHSNEPEHYRVIDNFLKSKNIVIGKAIALFPD